MAHDKALAHRVRGGLAGEPVDVDERGMFGGLVFMVQGHMCVGVLGDDLFVRVGHDGLKEALADHHARPMDFTGRPSPQMVYVDPGGVAADSELQTWVSRGLGHVRTLPSR